MRKDSPRLLLVAGWLAIAASAAGQMAQPLETSALLANTRLSPEARQAIQDRVDAVHARFRASHGGLGPEQFGVQCCQITQYPAAAFTTLYGDWNYDSYGYVYSQTPALKLWAPVQLPSGVEIQFLDLYYRDYDAADDVTATLQADSGGSSSSGPPAFLELASVSSSGSPGWGYAVVAVTHTVNNNVAYDPAAAQLNIRVEIVHQGTDVEFKAVDLWWMRQVSPAPTTATFSDVPTNHPFFQFVEALAAAGITAGYPDGRFGVDDSITRGQMAVFLAKALGLHWPL